jgi:hypothetical protein
MTCLWASIHGFKSYRNRLNNQTLVNKWTVASTEILGYCKRQRESNVNQKHPVVCTYLKVYK